MNAADYGVLLIRNDTDSPRLLSPEHANEKDLMAEVMDMVECGASEVLVFKLDATTARHFRMKPAVFEELTKCSPK